MDRSVRSFFLLRKNSEGNDDARRQREPALSVEIVVLASVVPPAETTLMPGGDDDAVGRLNTSSFTLSACYLAFESHPRRRRSTLKFFFNYYHTQILS